MSAIASTSANEVAGGRPIVARSSWDDFTRRIGTDVPALVAAGFLVLLVLAAVGGAPLARHLTGHPPNVQFTSALDVNGIPLGVGERSYLADSVTHDPNGSLFLLGADRLGRDVLVRLLYGARVSLAVAFGATLLATLIGTLLGLVAGFFGGRLDALISRMIETAMAFPALLLAIGLAVVLGQGLDNVIIVIAVFSWYYPARVVRTVTRSQRSAQFVEAAQSLGASDWRILRHHLLPQLVAPLMVYGTTFVAANVLFEAGLSYLGLGVPLPTASWGQMLADSVNSGLYRIVPSLALVPGIALMLTLLAFNVLGDGLRDALDPKAVY